MILTEENFVQMCKEYIEKIEKKVTLGTEVDGYQFTLKSQVEYERGNYIHVQKASYMFRNFTANETKRQQLESMSKELEQLEDELKIFLKAIAPKGIQITYEPSDRVDTLRYDNERILIG